MTDLSLRIFVFKFQSIEPGISRTLLSSGSAAARFYSPKPQTLNELEIRANAALQFTPLVVTPDTVARAASADSVSLPPCRTSIADAAAGEGESVNMPLLMKM